MEITVIKGKCDCCECGFEFEFAPFNVKKVKIICPQCGWLVMKITDPNEDLKEAKK